MTRTRRTLAALSLGAALAAGGGVAAAATWQAVAPQPPGATEEAAPTMARTLDLDDVLGVAPSITPSSPTTEAPAPGQPAVPSDVADDPAAAPTVAPPPVPRPAPPAAPVPATPAGPGAPDAQPGPYTPFVPSPGQTSPNGHQTPADAPESHPCFRQDPECYEERGLPVPQLDEERIGAARCPNPEHVIIRINPDVCGHPDGIA